MITKRLNHSGAVLLTVIMMTLVLSAIIVSIMSLNVSQVKTSQTIIDDIKAEYLAEGYFLKYQSEKALTGNASLPASDQTLDQQDFEITSQSTFYSEPGINRVQIDIIF